MREEMREGQRGLPAIWSAANFSSEKQLLMWGGRREGEGGWLGGGRGGGREGRVGEVRDMEGTRGEGEEEGQTERAHQSVSSVWF